MKTGRRGFTLVEIMLALAVLAVALTVLLAARARAVKAIRGIERAAVAQSLAERILAERIAMSRKAVGQEEGAVEGYPGYFYRVAVSEVGLPPPTDAATGDAKGDADKNTSRLYEIAVTVGCRDFGEERLFSLTTLFYDQPTLRSPEEDAR